jgi:hypothetical protein
MVPSLCCWSGARLPPRFNRPPGAGPEGTTLRGLSFRGLTRQGPRLAFKGRALDSPERAARRVPGLGPPGRSARCTARLPSRSTKSCSPSCFRLESEILVEALAECRVDCFRPRSSYLIAILLSFRDRAGVPNRPSPEVVTLARVNRQNESSNWRTGEYQHPLPPSQPHQPRPSLGHFAPLTGCMAASALHSSSAFRSQAMHPPSPVQASVRRPRLARSKRWRKQCGY